MLGVDALAGLQLAAPSDATEALAGNGSTTSKGTATLTVAIPLAGTGTTKSRGVASLATGANLAGNGYSTSTGSGTLTVGIALAGASRTTSMGTALLTIPVLLAGTGTSTSVGTGSLGVRLPLHAGGRTASRGTGALTVTLPSTTIVPLRNHLIDRETELAYPWPLNHSDEDPIRSLGRRLTRAGISASGRLTTTRTVVLVREPSHPGPIHLYLHGAMLDREPPTQFQTFVAFFNECDDRTFDYLDVSGDRYHVSIVSFDARRQLSPARPDGSYFKYTLELEVIDVISGPLVGYAV